MSNKEFKFLSKIDCESKVFFESKGEANALRFSAKRIRFVLSIFPKKNEKIEVFNIFKFCTFVFLRSEFASLSIFSQECEFAMRIGSPGPSKAN